LKISYSLKEGEWQRLNKFAKKISVQICQPPRVKLFRNDNLFLEEYAFITVESPFETRELKVQARFGNNEAPVVTRLFYGQKAAEQPVVLNDQLPASINI
jgi:hypothetical protein